ncbi:MAG TPA: GtrA family protein [Anaerolineae bacterium]|jgi:putative flippase GtrA|nr:GtrA family protein [Anaerolineae bacterium]
MPSEAHDLAPGSERDHFRTLRQPWLMQALRFALVGILNTVVDGGLYFLLTRWLGLGELKILAKAISYSVAVLNSYLWNRSWTFRSRSRSGATFVPFVLANLLGLAINSGVMYAGLHQFGLSDSLAFFLATAVTFFCNFSVNKLVVFRK